MQRGLFLDVVVGQSAAVLQLLSGEDQTLLVGRDALLVLDLGLHVLDGVWREKSRESYDRNSHKYPATEI